MPAARTATAAALVAVLGLTACAQAPRRQRLAVRLLLAAVPVGRDGLLKGCNVEATLALAKAQSLPVIASGGVAGIEDIHALAPHAQDGIEGVITGRALYDGRLDLAEALRVGTGV